MVGKSVSQYQCHPGKYKYIHVQIVYIFIFAQKTIILVYEEDITCTKRTTVLNKSEYQCLI